MTELETGVKSDWDSKNELQLIPASIFQTMGEAAPLRFYIAQIDFIRAAEGSAQYEWAI